MSPLHRYLRVALVAVTAALLSASTMPAMAAPNARDVAAGRDRVDAVLQRLESAERRSSLVDEQLRTTTAKLDAVLEEQHRTRTQLLTRANSMYRSGEIGMVEFLLGAETFEDFQARWYLLTRMNLSDAASLRRLARLRAQTRKASDELLRLQARSVRAEDALAEELADARAKLASDRAALAAYERAAAARAAAAKRARSAASAPAPAETAAAPATAARPGRGGPWRTGVASHYGRDFRGRGANGEAIGPYSMMCAHKTLPFGTLVEFEYNGRRAIAKVADRGPFTPGRDFDLGPGVVRVLGFEGVHQVRWRIVER